MLNTVRSLLLVVVISLQPFFYFIRIGLIESNTTMSILTWLSLVMLITWLLCECIPIWVRYLVLREIELYDIKKRRDDNERNKK